MPVQKLWRDLSLRRNASLTWHGTAISREKSPFYHSEIPTKTQGGTCEPPKRTHIRKLVTNMFSDHRRMSATINSKPPTRTMWSILKLRKTAESHPGEWNSVHLISTPLDPNQVEQARVLEHVLAQSSTCLTSMQKRNKKINKRKSNKLKSQMSIISIRNHFQFGFLTFQSSHHQASSTGHLK